MVGHELTLPGSTTSRRGMRHRIRRAGGQLDGLGIRGTPGVASRPASQGSAAPKALLAKGQS